MEECCSDPSNRVWNLREATREEAPALLSRGQRAGEPLDRDTRCNGMGLCAADAGAAGP